MARLRKADERFLEAHDIPLAATFDASGLATRDWKAAMRCEGKLIAYGVSCLRGHSLKTRSGNCIRCNTANIAFGMRPDREGFVYLARSPGAKLVKVGFSANDPHGRIAIANCEGYGGARDWRIRTIARSGTAGRLELDLHSALRRWRAPQAWIRNGVPCEAREIYACRLASARRHLADLLIHDPEAAIAHL